MLVLQTMLTAVERGIGVHPCCGSWCEHRVRQDDVTGDDRISQHAIAGASGGPSHLNRQSRPCSCHCLLLCASDQVGTGKVSLHFEIQRLQLTLRTTIINQPSGQSSLDAKAAFTLHGMAIYGSWPLITSDKVLVRHIKHCSVAGCCQCNPVTVLCLHCFPCCQPFAVSNCGNAHSAPAAGIAYCDVQTTICLQYVFAAFESTTNGLYQALCPWLQGCC